MLMQRVAGSATARVVGLAAISWGYSMLIVNRWAFTDLGVRSFGRVWMLYVSWSDVGFVRRSLLGTVLTESRLNRLTGDEYLFAHVFWAAMLTVCVVLLAVAILQREPVRRDGWLVAAILLSPAFLSHLAYATGTLDLPLVVLFLLCALYVRNPVGVAALAGLGILVHELFLFMVPAIVVIQVLRLDNPQQVRRAVAIVGGTAAAVALAVVIAGSLNVPQADYEAVMASRMPSAFGDHPLWSGHFELSSSFGDNQFYVRWLSDEIATSWWWAVVPCLYLLALFWVIGRFTTGPAFQRLLMIAACAAPLLASFAARDFYRWLSMAAIASIVLLVALAGLGRTRIPRFALVALTAFALLGPVGAAGLDRPFPVHQEIVEMLSGGRGNP